MAAENARSNSPILPSTKKSKTSIKNSYNYNIISHAIYIFIIPGIFYALIHHIHHDNSAITLVFLSTMIVAVLHISTMILRSRRRVYLLDFSCYKHDPSFSVSTETLYEKLSAASVSPESLAFTRRVVGRSGTSDTAFVYGLDDFPPKSLFACARGEAETVICGAVDDLMIKTGVDRGEIGVVIVNASTFNPVPSLSAMIVNRYKLREDVLSYNLGGMGCSAGVIAVDLAKRLLKVRVFYTVFTMLIIFIT